MRTYVFAKYFQLFLNKLYIFRYSILFYNLEVNFQEFDFIFNMNFILHFLKHIGNEELEWLYIGKIMSLFN